MSDATISLILAGLAVWAAVLGVLLWISRATIQAILAPFCLAISIGLFNLWQLARNPLAGNEPQVPLAFQLDGLGLHSHVVVAYICCRLISRYKVHESRGANGLWDNLIVIELYSVVADRIGCNILGSDIPWEQLKQDWATEVSGYACARTQSAWWVIAPLAVLYLPFSAIALGMVEWQRVRRLIS